MAPFSRRQLLPQSGDVETNPGPQPPQHKTARINSSKTKSDNGKMMTFDAASELKAIMEKQTEMIKAQKEDIDDLRKKLEANVRVTEDFKAELSEIRKKVNSDRRGSDDGSSGSGSGGDVDADAGLSAKLDALCAAYNDIQDRLYEIDKSWKNNVVLFGVPAADSNSIEEDPIVTEEKVSMRSKVPKYSLLEYMQAVMHN